MSSFSLACLLSEYTRVATDSRMRIEAKMRKSTWQWRGSLEPGTTPPRTIITYVKREEGESLVFLDHVLDIDDVFGRGFELTVTFTHARVQNEV